MAKQILFDCDALPKSAKEARAVGSAWYFTGKACKRGHVAARYTSTCSCVVCQNEHDAHWKENNLERYRQLDREAAARSYAKDPEPWKRAARDYYWQNREKCQAYNNLYHQNNLECLRAKDRARYHQQDRAIRRLREKLNYPRDRERILAANRNREALKRNAPGKHTAADIRAIRAEQNDHCKLCGRSLEGKGHVDHKIPLSRGGSNWPVNLQLLCPACNIRKGAHMLKITRPK